MRGVSVCVCVGGGGGMWEVKGRKAVAEDCRDPTGRKPS